MPIGPIISEALYGDVSAIEMHKSALAGHPRAEEILHESLRSATDVPTQYERVAQIAYIGASLGFIKVSSAIRSNDIVALRQGEATIHANSFPFISQLAEHGRSLTNKAREESYAIHGAISAVLGRTATAKQVMLENTASKSRNIRLAQKEGDRQYAQAHALLKQGNSGYHLVANAMAAARHHRMNGNTAETLAWTGRALAGLTWSAINDRPSLAPVRKSITQHARAIISKKHARRSVVTSL